MPNTTRTGKENQKRGVCVGLSTVELSSRFVLFVCLSCSLQFSPLTASHSQPSDCCSLLLLLLYMLPLFLCPPRRKGRRHEVRASGQCKREREWEPRGRCVVCCDVGVFSCVDYCCCTYQENMKIFLLIFFFLECSVRLVPVRNNYARIHRSPFAVTQK